MLALGFLAISWACPAGGRCLGNAIELCETEDSWGILLAHSHTYDDPTTDCVGYASKLRLTDSYPNMTGAYWWDTAFEVKAGFQATFSFNISGRSHSCLMDPHLAQSCTTRGGEGLAFVFSGTTPAPTTHIGSGGQGLGYAGVPNAVALEIDFINQNANMDLWHNHISLHTGGNLASLSSHHETSLGYSTNVTDYQKNYTPHTIKMIYEPNIEPDKFHPTECRHAQTCGHTQVTAQFTNLWQQGLFPDLLGAIETIWTFRSLFRRRGLTPC